MPSKYNKLPIPYDNDKRRKLSIGDKMKIKRLYATGLYSQYKLADMFGVSRRLIQFTLYPERYEIQKEQYKTRQQTKRYYDKDKQKEYMRNYRKHKKEIYDKI